MSRMVNKPSNPDEGLEALLSLAESAPSQTPLVPARRVGGAFQELGEAISAWAQDMGVRPGGNPSLMAADLCRHFMAWCVENGHQAPQFSPAGWGRALKHDLGLVRGREYHNGRDSRPYLMAANPARAFQAWLEANPTPPLGETGFEAHKAVFRATALDPEANLSND